MENKVPPENKAQTDNNLLVEIEEMGLKRLYKILRIYNFYGSVVENVLTDSKVFMADLENVKNPTDHRSELVSKLISDFKIITQ